MRGTDPVVTKRHAGEQSGNDADSITTKLRPINRTFGNDASLVTTPGFIRVRKRTLKGGHPMWRSGAKTSMSFDLVRAVRVNGKPRHQFVLGLGSQQAVRPGYRNDIVSFWDRAIHRMTRHGILQPQRQYLIAEMVRKGARLPSADECEADIKNRRAIAELYGWKSPDSNALDELRSQFPEALRSER
jgi:hypothetical protein